MRDYIIHEAQSRAAFGRLSALVRRITNWQTRKDLKTLLKMSDYQLRDIGLNKVQVLGLINLPLSCDLAWELERLGKDTHTISQTQFEGETRCLPLSPAEGGPVLFARSYMAGK